MGLFTQLVVLMLCCRSCVMYVRHFIEGDKTGMNGCMLPW